LSGELQKNCYMFYQNTTLITHVFSSSRSYNYRLIYSITAGVPNVNVQSLHQHTSVLKSCMHVISHNGCVNDVLSNAVPNVQQMPS